MGCGVSKGRASAHVVPGLDDDDEGAAQELEEPSSFEEAINEIFPKSFEAKVSPHPSCRCPFGAAACCCRPRSPVGCCYTAPHRHAFRSATRRGERRRGEKGGGEGPPWSALVDQVATATIDAVT